LALWNNFALLISAYFIFTCHSLKGVLRIAIHSLNLDLALTSLHLPYYAEGIIINGFRFCNRVAGTLPAWAVVTTRHESWYRKSAQRRISRSALQRFLQGISTYACAMLRITMRLQTHLLTSSQENKTVQKQPSTNEVDSRDIIVP
jgi:hypothetical protein